jgi:hypothetical protein
MIASLHTLLRSILISCAYRAYELEVSMWNGTLDAVY